MNIILWLGLGLFAGGLASRILDDTAEETLFDIFLGVVGSLISGFLLYELGSQSVNINIFQLFTLFLSSVFLIALKNNIKHAKAAK